MFLLDRSFSECLDRLTLIQRRFGSALLIGCPDPKWVDRLREQVPAVTVLEPGKVFSGRAGAEATIEDHWVPVPESFDLCLAVGTLDTVNDLPAVLGSIRASLRPDGLLLGAVAGGDSLPMLRAAMHAADQAIGGATPHVHPRIDPPTLAALLSASGFVMPVVDVDRVKVSYAAFADLITDLRKMGATNILRARSTRSISRAAWVAARECFENVEGATVEIFEILHFAGWAPMSANGIRPR